MRSTGTAVPVLHLLDAGLWRSLREVDRREDGGLLQWLETAARDAKAACERDVRGVLAGADALEELEEYVVRHAARRFGVECDGHGQPQRSMHRDAVEHWPSRVNCV